MTRDVQAALEREKAVFLEQARAAGKPANVAEMLVKGKLGKYYADVCLLEQPFALDDSVKSVRDLIRGVEKQLGGGAAVSVTGFAVQKCGEAVAAAPGAAQ